MDRADIYGDEATYSFRAIGYLDYLGSEQQTTPVQWFNGQIPWWSKLSFHDAPPLVFIIQYIFFKFIGVSTFTARLPFVVFGTLSVYLIFLITKKLFNNENLGLITSFILAILNYHIWISRTGYLEGILIFFILLGFYYFLKLLENNSWKNYFLVGLTLGLAFLCKYTMLFLLPTYFFYLLIFKRPVLSNKKIFLAIIVFFIVISPVIFYNIMVYKTRGHLDLQFSQVLGMDLSKDWPLFTKGAGEKNLWQNFKGVFGTLYQALGVYCFYLFIISLISWLVAVFIKNIKNKEKISLILLALLFLIIQFTFSGAGPRFLPIFAPFVALIIGYLVFFIFNLLSKKIFKYLFFGLVSVLVLFTIWEDINN